MKTTQYYVLFGKSKIDGVFCQLFGAYSKADCIEEKALCKHEYKGFEIVSFSTDKDLNFELINYVAAKNLIK